MPTRTFLAIAATVFILWSATASLAASLTVSPATGNSFTIQGNNMDDIAGIDLVVSYDGSLSVPRVNAGSLLSAAGATFLINLNFAPNTIKMAAVTFTTFSGNGPIATITFGKGSGSLKIVSKELITSSGASVNGTASSDPPATITQPGVPFTYPGTVSMPSDGQSKNETKPADTPATPIEPPAETPAVAVSSAKPDDQPVVEKSVETKKAENRKTTVYSAVIERFRVYQGEKSPAILASLFKKEVAPSIRQQPAVALSDGTTSVRIVATLSSPDGKSPNFALSGATLVSLKNDNESGNWIIEVLPRKNVVKASLTILAGNEDIEFPLTVAPPVKDRAISEAGFAAFLKNADSKATDLNGDGRRDFIDEYIYAANYLVRLEEKTKKKAPAR